MEDSLLMISGLQHFAFCRRQWALIHIEQQWRDNGYTAEGQIFHERAHNGDAVESRGDTIIMRGLRVQSNKLGLTGICDVVEFRRRPEGIMLSGREGCFEVYPIEYKKGAPKQYEGGNADSLQLCAEAICLEEMLSCTIQEGSLFYGETRRRERICFSEELRGTVIRMSQEMHNYWDRGYTPDARAHRGCQGCSMKEICLPKKKRLSVAEYINRKRQEEAE